MSSSSASKYSSFVTLKSGGKIESILRILEISFILKSISLISFNSRFLPSMTLLIIAGLISHLSITLLRVVRLLSFSIFLIRICFSFEYSNFFRISDFLSSSESNDFFLSSS
ncbi:MAG: hypothetical protein PHZ26_05640 [Candidatus Gracilibacteria bacterium]|nr:hypothetical protein [Candidatus Gracilibacteria bacterium]